MGTKNKPGAFDYYANAHPDEPMFVLLGRDRDAPKLIRQWAWLREATGEASEKVSEARQCADAMDAWAERIGKRDPMQRDHHKPDAPDWPKLLKDLVEALPGCTICSRPATRAFVERGGAQYCDAHDTQACPEYPRAGPLRAAVAALAAVR